MNTLELNWLALNLIPNLGVQTLLKLLEHFGSVENLLQIPEAELIQKSGISAKMAHRIAKAREVPSFQIEQRLIQESGVELLCLESESYPYLLKEISAPPPILYRKGNLKQIEAPCIAIVGSRTCTAYGKKHTRRLVLELSELLPEAIIVSGLARGIDTIAHQTALEAGLSTIAVLAGGLKNIYPSENQALAEAIQDQGALLSEFPIGSKPLGRNFPIRNRIISGLSQGLVVIEAGNKSGALITAAFGLQHNRDIFALPGSVDAPASQGTNRLIARNQAKLIVQAKDIVEELQLATPKVLQTEFPFLSAVPSSSPQTICLSSLSPPQAQILQTLELGQQDIDTIFSKTQIEINELLGLLVELELMGLIHSLAGQRYQLEETIVLQ